MIGCLPQGAGLITQTLFTAGNTPFYATLKNDKTWCYFKSSTVDLLSPETETVE